MTASKCDYCGAPLNFALSKCAYCGTAIQSKFGQAFPVRCPWNGTRTCGETRSNESYGAYSRHCVHCHSPEPHPMSPEGQLIHSDRRLVPNASGKLDEQSVCPACYTASFSVVAPGVFLLKVYSDYDGYGTLRGECLVHRAWEDDSRRCPSCMPKMLADIEVYNKTVTEKFETEHPSKPAVTPAPKKPGFWALLLGSD